jgi:hypothetical protein
VLCNVTTSLYPLSRRETLDINQFALEVVKQADLSSIRGGRKDGELQLYRAIQFDHRADYWGDDALPKSVKSSANRSR